MAWPRAVQAAKNPGNDGAVKRKVWQASQPKCKLNFPIAALAGRAALIKDNVSRGLRMSCESS